ncbi:MAG: sulfite exporter TauE/SafE family protein [Pseudomonadota bacterium]
MIAEAFATPGIAWLIFAAFLANAVRGFSGFGSGMIYIPIASRVLEPVEALATMAIFDFLAPVPILRSSLKRADKVDLLILFLGLAMLMPLGFFVLTRISPEGFGWVVSLVIFTVLAALVSGWRYQGSLNRIKVLGIGAVSGFFGGFLGLPGPPAILSYMASTKPIEVIRANLLIFLFTSDMILITILASTGNLPPNLLTLGLLLALPAMAGSLVGSWIFNPAHEKTYRFVAYMIIAVAALSALPILH